MHVLEHVLLGMCIAGLAVAIVCAARGRIAAAFAHVALATVLGGAAVALGGMPWSADLGIAAMAAGWAATAWRTARRSTSAQWRGTRTRSNALYDVKIGAER